MKQITIKIETINAAFEEAPEVEVARILTRVARELYMLADGQKLRDINGNTCGLIRIIG